METSPVRFVRLLRARREAPPPCSSDHRLRPPQPAGSFTTTRYLRRATLNATPADWQSARWDCQAPAAPSRRFALFWSVPHPLPQTCVCGRSRRVGGVSPQPPRHFEADVRSEGDLFAVAEEDPLLECQCNKNQQRPRDEGPARTFGRHQRAAEHGGDDPRGPHDGFVARQVAGAFGGWTREWKTSRK